MGTWETMENMDPLLARLSATTLRDLLDMYFVCGVGNEFYRFSKEELVWMIPLGCGVACAISYIIYQVHNPLVEET